MKYKVKRKRVNYAKEKALLFLMFAMVVGVFSIMSFYAGQKYAIENTKAHYYSGDVILELNGQMYNLVTERN